MLGLHDANVRLVNVRQTQTLASISVFLRRLKVVLSGIQRYGLAEDCSVVLPHWWQSVWKQCALGANRVP